jgi:hypothetical protein
MKTKYNVIVEEKQEVCLDWEMSRRIAEAQGVVDNNTDSKGPWHGCGLLGMHWRIQGRLRWSLDAKRMIDRLHLKETEKAWGELRDTWFGVVSHHICLEDLETLPCWTKIWTKHWPLWTTTHFYAKQPERTTTTLVRIA